ncbi:MAG: rhodanese-like domain-containing protein [Gracilimonas sp.]
MSEQKLVKEICPGTTQNWISNGALLVDVRETEEIEQLSFDVPNLMHIPLSEFESRFSEIPVNTDVVMVCQVGVRSLRAAGFLVNHGYTQVVNMKYGMNRWIEKGYPVKGTTLKVSMNGGGCCSSDSCC